MTKESQQCNAGSWIGPWNRKKGIIEKPVIQIESIFKLIILYQCDFLSFDNCSMVKQDVNIRGSWVKGIDR